MLDIKSELLNEPLLSLAGDELRKINVFKSPGEKVACIVKCVAIIFRSLSLARVKQGDNDQHHTQQDNTPAGADDFLPLLIWVVLRCRIPHLYSNCDYIQSYLHPARLMGKSGYCLINLRSAIEFVTYLDSSALNMESQLFDEQLQAAADMYRQNMLKSDKTT